MRAAAVAVFAAVCFLSSANLALMVKCWIYEGVDVEEEQARYAALRPYLPREGTVGFETDRPDNAMKDYFLA